MPIIQQFCNHLLLQRRYSSHTIIAYKKDLTQFFSYLKSEFEITSYQQVTAPIIRSWMAKLLEDNTSKRTINRKTSTLKSFFKYLLKNELIDKNPTISISNLKTSQPLPSFIREQNINTLIDELEFPDTFEGERDRLIIEMFYHTGIRLSELINLTTNSYDKSNSTIKVIGKRNKERIIPCSKSLQEKINKFLITRKQISSNSDYIFLTKKGEKTYPKLVYRLVNRYLSTITTANKKSPHVLRHTFATHMLNNGANLNSIKEILGHTNLSATQVYTHNTIEKLKNIHKLAHPKS